MVRTPAPPDPPLSAEHAPEASDGVEGEEATTHETMMYLRLPMKFLWEEAAKPRGATDAVFDTADRPRLCERNSPLKAGLLAQRPAHLLMRDPLSFGVQ